MLGRRGSADPVGPCGTAISARPEHSARSRRHRSNSGLAGKSGGGGIRTLGGRVTPTTVFEICVRRDERRIGIGVYGLAEGPWDSLWDRRRSIARAQFTSGHHERSPLVPRRGGAPRSATSCCAASSKETSSREHALHGRRRDAGSPL